MAADVGRDMHGTDLVACEFQRREHRPFWATDAKCRRPRRHMRDQCIGRARAHVCQCAQLRIAGIDFVETDTQLAQKVEQASGDQFSGVLAGHRQHIFAMQWRLQIGATQDRIEFLFNVLRLTLFKHQHCALAGAKLRDLLGHQRIDRVQAQYRYT